MNARERRPGDDSGAAAKEAEDTTNLNLTRGSDVFEQLRRRRAASQQLAILACGHADPLDCLTACRPIPDTPRNLEASRRAWWHLRDHGLMSEHVEAVLAEAEVVA